MVQIRKQLGSMGWRTVSTSELDDVVYGSSAVAESKALIVRIDAQIKGVPGGAYPTREVST